MTQINLQNFIKNGSKIIGAAYNFKGSITSNAIPQPKNPVLFLKPISSYIVEGQSINIPKDFTNVIHEVELGIVIGKTCRNASVQEAMNFVGGYCLALDMTALCYIEKACQSSYAWGIGKAFDTSTPVSRFILKDEIKNPDDIRLWLKLNGEMKQEQSTSNLLFSIPELISFSSKFITLEPNDLILSGTPPGATKVNNGDIIECGIGNILNIKFNVKDK